MKRIEKVFSLQKLLLVSALTLFPLLVNGQVPSAPTALAATSYSPSGSSLSFQANWSLPAGATSFLLDVSMSSSFSGFVFANQEVFNTFYNVTGLTAGNTYYYRVRAKNGTGNSSYSNTISVYPPPPVPAMPVGASATGTTIQVSWNSIAVATQYRLDVSLDNFSTFVPNYNNRVVASAVETVTGLTAGTTYQFRVRSENPTATSISSPIGSYKTLPAVPTLNTPASPIASTSFGASWGSVPSATAYTLQVSTNNVFTNIVGTPITTASTNASPSGLQPATTYWYRVLATNSSGNSSYSSPQSVTTILDPPGTPTASSVTVNSFVVSWGAVSGATSYLLDVPGVSGYQGLSVAGTSQSVTGLSAGTTYTFYVRAKNGSVVSNQSPTGNTITVPAAPTASSASSVTASSFQANWSGVAGAASFRLDVGTNTSFTPPLTGYGDRTVSTTTELVSPTNTSNIYYYRVRAVNASGTSTNSSTIAVYPPPPAPNTPVGSAATGTSIQVSWNSITVATQYRLDVSLDNFATFVTNYNNRVVTSTVETVTGLTPGITYQFRVRSENPTFTSASSSPGNYKTLPAVPTLNTPASPIGSTSFGASWGSVASATGYTLQVGTDVNFTGIVGAPITTASTNASPSGLSPASTYWYRVFATNSSGNSAYSSPQSVTTTLDVPATPTATLAEVKATSFLLTWPVVSGAASYLLDVSTHPSAAQNYVAGYQGLSVSSTSQLVNGLTAGTTYYFRLRAVKNAVTSQPSPIGNQLTATGAPVANTPDQYTGTSFRANWSAVGGASGYRLDVSTSSSFDANGIVPNYSNKTISASTSDVVSPIVLDKIFYYRVRAVNAANAISDNSNVEKAYPVPSAPTVQAATSVGSNSFVANWSSVTVATSYLVDVASDVNFNTLVQSGVATTDLAVTISGLTPSTPYYYRVRAVNPRATSVNSSGMPVTTLSAAPVATAASVVTGTSFIANWASTAEDLYTYKLDLALNNTFSPAIFTDRTFYSKSATLIDLSPGVTYYYRVRSFVGTNPSAYSNIVSVTTLGVAGAANENFIRSNTVLVANKTDGAAIDGLPITERSQSVQYLDGLGKPKQIIGRQASPSLFDIVTPILYDQFGRETRKYVPYVSTGTNGSFVDNGTIVDAATANYKGAALSFYQNAAKIANLSTHQYAQTDFEASPLNRVEKQGAPGPEWQPSTGRVIKKSYRANLSQEVFRFDYNETTGAVSLSSVVASRFYDPNLLQATVTLDEQDNEVVEFQDKEGKVVCKKVKEAANQYVSTYYLYDKFGNLSTVLSPAAVKELSK